MKNFTQNLDSLIKELEEVRQEIKNTLDNLSE